MVRPEHFLIRTKIFVTGLWRGWCFAMIGRKNCKIYLDVAYILSSNSNACFAYLEKFLAGFVIPDAIEYNLILNTFHKMRIKISSEAL